MSKKPINMRIDTDLLEKIKEQAAKEKRPLTNLVEYALWNYLQFIKISK